MESRAQYRTINLTGWLLLLGLLCSASLHAEEANCLLWEVPGERNTVYLLGSIHMMRAEDYPLDQCVERAYQKADQLVVELNILVIDPLLMFQKMQRFGVLPDGTVLSSQLSDETARQLAKLKNLPAGYQRMRPWYLALTLALQKLATLGYRADLGVDHYLINKAQGVKPIISLESLDQQLAVLAGDSAEQQDLSLRLTLEQLPDIAGDLEQMSLAWHQGDAEAIYRLMERPKQQYPELAAPFERQVIERNHGMADKILTMLKEKDDYLVVVGGGHLGGEQGIISLLEKQGLTLTQQPKLGRTMLY